MANKRFPPPATATTRKLPPLVKQRKDPPAVFGLVSRRGATPVELSSLPSCFLFPANFNGIFRRAKIQKYERMHCKFVGEYGGICLSVILDPIFCKEKLIECLPSTVVRRRYLKLNVDFAYFRTCATETYCRKKESPSFLPSPPSHINQATVEGPQSVRRLLPKKKRTEGIHSKEKRKIFLGTNPRIPYKNRNKKRKCAFALLSSVGFRRRNLTLFFPEEIFFWWGVRPRTFSRIFTAKVWHTNYSSTWHRNV